MIPGLAPRSPFTATSSRLKPTAGETKLRIVCAVLAVVASVLLYWIACGPGRTPESRQLQVQTLEAQQRALQARVAELRELTVRVQSATKTSQEFATGNFLSRSNAFSTMVKSLEELAVKNDLQPGSTTYELLDQTNELGWTGVSVKMALAGDYADLVRFINAVEKSKIFWIIRGLNVAGDSESGLRLSLTADTYLLPVQN